MDIFKEHVARDGSYFDSSNCIKQGFAVRVSYLDLLKCIKHGMSDKQNAIESLHSCM